jgi:hypothetical protein
MTLRLCKYCNGWHDVDAWPGNCMPERIYTKSDLPSPMIISDTIEPTQSMADGKFYTSKAAIRATYKPSGNKDGKSYIEVGNDSSVVNPKPFKRPKPDRKEVRKSIEKAFSRVGIGS